MAWLILFSLGEQPRHMSSAVYILRAFLANLIALPPSRLYRTFFDRDTDRNHELQVGDCRFWGSEEFTSSCRSAMAELKSADKQMFARLTSSGSLTFWLKPAMLKDRVYNKKARFYSIDPAYYVWGAQGIVAFIVGIHFDETYTPRFLGIPVETPLSRIAYRQAAIEWLSTHDYPSALIEPLRTTNSPNQAMQRTAPRSDA